MLFIHEARHNIVVYKHYYFYVYYVANECIRSFEVLATSSKSKFSRILNTVASSPETRELSCKTKLQLSAPATWKIKWESVSDLSELIIEFTFFLIGPV